MSTLTAYDGYLPSWPHRCLDAHQMPSRLFLGQQPAKINCLCASSLVRPNHLQQKDCCPTLNSQHRTFALLSWHNRSPASLNCFRSLTQLPSTAFRRSDSQATLEHIPKLYPRHRKNPALKLSPGFFQCHFGILGYALNAQ
jgi:hypothetical protein